MAVFKSFKPLLLLVSITFTLSLVSIYFNQAPYSSWSSSSPKTSSLPQVDSTKIAPFDNMYIINPAHRTDRIVTTIKMFRHIGLEPTVIDGVNKIIYENKTFKSAGMKACRESHRKALRQVVLNQDRFAIIFEDDIDFQVDFADQLREFGKQVPVDWDMVHFGHCLEKPGKRWGDLHVNNNTFRVQHAVSPFCGHAYGVSQRGAQEVCLTDQHIVAQVDRQVFQQRSHQGAILEKSSLRFSLPQNDQRKNCL